MYNALNGSVGAYAGSDMNTVLITDNGSVWSNGAAWAIGGGGTNNQLTIANGGKMYSPGGSIAAAVLVTGAGSVWYNSASLTIGNGTNNQLTIANGGTVYDAGGYIGAAASGKNNGALVTDAGSVWTNSGDLTIGRYYAVGNQLTITNGGTVCSANGYIGSSTAASNNTVFVSGRGSAWRMTSWLGINGGLSTGNGLILSNGGVAAVSGAGTVLIYAGGYVTNYVAGIAGGLDMSAGNAFTLNGKMGIVFTAPPTQIGPFWGLRWAGSHVAALQGYTNSAALTISDTALPDLWRNRASIYSDGTNTYVGFDVSHLPVGGTIVTVF